MSSVPAFWWRALLDPRVSAARRSVHRLGAACSGLVAPVLLSFRPSVSRPRCCFGGLYPADRASWRVAQCAAARELGVPRASVDHYDPAVPVGGRRSVRRHAARIFLARRSGGFRRVRRRFVALEERVAQDYAEDILDRSGVGSGFVGCPCHPALPFCIEAALDVFPAERVDLERLEPFGLRPQLLCGGRHPLARFELPLDLFPELVQLQWTAARGRLLSTTACQEQQRVERAPRLGSLVPYLFPERLEAGVDPFP